MSRTSLDRFEDRYAQRMHGMRSSAMRDLMAITARPDVISLAGGLPDTSAFDPKAFIALTRDIGTDSHAAALQYGPTEGFEPLKHVIASIMEHEGMDVEPSHLIVTTGGQQVLDLVARTFVDPGDVVLAEGPTYPGVVPVFSSYQADVRHLPLDAEGLDPDLLVQVLDELHARGKRPKYLYTIPTFQNPAGVTTTLERRQRIVQIAAERDLLVLEDNPYSMLRYEGDPVPPLRALDEHGNVIYLGTFSKIFAPGVRIGWLEAPAPILAKVNLAKQAADLCSNTLTQHLLHRFFTEHDWRAYISRLCGVYRGRRDRMVAALEEHFPETASWTVPQGGLFMWVTLPAYLDTTDLLARALQQNVAFVPGGAAFLDGTGTSSMRLNFSAVDEATIEEGIRRIGAVIHDAMELAQQLGVDVQERQAPHEVPGHAHEDEPPAITGEPQPGVTAQAETTTGGGAR